MSPYDDLDGTYANGADGTCQECGEPTDEEWHRLCSDCFAEEQGWKRPARPTPGTPPPSFVEGLAGVRDRVAVLEREVQLLKHLLMGKASKGAA